MIIVYHPYMKLLLLFFIFYFSIITFFLMFGDNVYVCKVIFFCVSKTVLPIFYNVYDMQMYKIIYYIM
jgi:hypothetical protein